MGNMTDSERLEPFIFFSHVGHSPYDRLRDFEGWWWQHFRFGVNDRPVAIRESGKGWTYSPPVR